jgi:hypothetical protein
MGNQESSCNGREYAAEVAGKIFPPSPETESCWGRATLHDCHHIPGGKPNHGRRAQEGQSRPGVRDPHRRNEHQSAKEGYSKHPLACPRLIPA